MQENMFVNRLCYLFDLLARLACSNAFQVPMERRLRPGRRARRTSRLRRPSSNNNIKHDPPPS